MKGSEIVQVQGGHIIRATGRKDRHSKVFTAKGPRDRRVRLSAHTAIQFYDVQDRLGYDRPSKALDWLIHKAKNAINQLNGIPPWNPSTDNIAVVPRSDSNLSCSGELAQDHPEIHPENTSNISNPSTSTYSFMHTTVDVNSNMKSLFPTNSVNFPNGGILPRASFHEEDLGLSLQSLQADQNGTENHGHNPLLSGSNLMGFQDSFQRSTTDSWNSSSGNMEAISQQGYFPEGLEFSQRDLLQSNLFADHAWNNERPFSAADHNYQQPRARQQSSDSGNHFDLGFHVPAQFYAEDGEGMDG